jgi:hypothetical protein
MVQSVLLVLQAIVRREMELVYSCEFYTIDGSDIDDRTILYIGANVSIAC